MVKKSAESGKTRLFRHGNFFIVLGCIALVGLSFWFLTKSVNDNIINANSEAMEELALHDGSNVRNSIAIRFEFLEAKGKELSGRTFPDFDSVFDELREIVKTVPSADRVSLLDSNGTEYVSNGLVTKNSYLADVCQGKTGRFIIRLNTAASLPESVKEVLFEAVPVDLTVDGREMEWLICQFPINTLEKELKISSYGGNGYSSVIDKDGYYILNMARTHNFMSRDNIFEDLRDAKLNGYGSLEEVCAGAVTTTSVIYTKDGQKNIMVITPFDIADWFLVTTVPISVFAVQSRAVLSRFILLLAVLAVILAGLSVLFLRQRKQKTELQLSEAANKSKTEFLFNMSHDIRTPMNAILGYTDIGLRYADDAERSKDCFRKIRMAGSHLLSLINDILEMSRIEAGSLEITEDPTDIRQAVEKISLMSQALAIQKEIDFETTVGEIRNPYVYADELHVNEVIINLISNAVKYTKPGGKVRYQVQQIGGIVDGKVILRMEVTDNGIGMSEEFQQHLFEAFSRERSSVVSKQEGAGLGLSIVKRIVDLSGGTILLKSRQNEGTAFTVELPFRVMEEEAIAQFKAANEQNMNAAGNANLEGKKVLVAEDNEMNREIISDILEEAGLVIETAEDGEMALKAVIARGVNYYDFILMDIQMPVMNGYEATKAIRSLPDGSRIPIIALSANAFEEDRQKSLSVGMNAHVAKPIDVRILFDTLNQLVK